MPKRALFLCVGGCDKADNKLFLVKKVTTEDPEARLDLLTNPTQMMHKPWARSLFKEIGEGAQSTYFMYVLVK